jgi:hypothetical protein
MKKSNRDEDITEITPLVPKAAPVEASDPPYCAASREEQIALFAVHGRDNVKAIPGFRNMSLSAIRAALKK